MHICVILACKIGGDCRFYFDSFNFMQTVVLDRFDVFVKGIAIAVRMRKKRTAN